MFTFSNSYSAKQELDSLPSDYTFELAIESKDIIISPVKTYNIDRFYKFLDNIEKGIKDRVRITTYGIDGPPTISILEYNGNLIKYTIDATRYDGVEFYSTFYGVGIREKGEEKGKFILKEFYFIKLNRDEFRMFGYRQRI